MSMHGDSVRAAVLDAPDADPRVVRFPLPTLTPRSALLSTLYSEVCGTDVHIWHGKVPGVHYPMIPGHVTVGTLAAMSGPMTDLAGESFKEGDVVTFLDVHETCNHCYQCLVAKQTTRCPHRRVYGITYDVRDGLLGGWSEVVWLKPGLKLVRIPKGLDPETFIGGGCGLVTAIHAIDRAEIRLGQTVVVLGAGPVGQSIVALAALSGAGQVVAIGGPADRLAFARRMGATHTIGLDIPPTDRAAAVRLLTGGRGADVVIEAAGAPEAVTQALDLVRDGGRVAVCGQYADNGDASFNPHRHINRKQVELRGVWGSDYSHFHRAVEFAAHFGGKVPWREQVSGSYGLEQVKDALQAVEQQRVLKALVVPGR
ncbi:MAG TPA: zinc-binding dehydrogenase [Gemmatimonadales bacterium]|nr:zinc-binding dehydrogenase [Gemmatimonadales bacterium]